MPPKTTKEPKRRTRTDSVKEDLLRLLNEQEESDEIFYVVLKEAIEEGVFEDLEAYQKWHVFVHFAACGMMKCFEEMYYVFVTNFQPSQISVILHTVCSSSGSDEDALKMARMLLVQIRKFESVAEESDWIQVIPATVQFARLPIARAMLAKWKEISVPRRKNQDGRTINTLGTALLREGVQQASVEVVRLALPSSCELPVDASVVVKAATLTASTILEMLLDAGADIESENAAGETPLLAAVRSGSLSNVKFLIQRNKQNGFFLDVYTAILNAIEYRRTEILKELMDMGGFVVCLSSLCACVANGDFDCFKILFPKTHQIKEVLMCVVSHQKYDMLSFALFECTNTSKVMKTDDFERLLKKATNDDIKSLLQKKVDIMNGKGDVKVEAVKKEDTKVGKKRKTK